MIIRRVYKSIIFIIFQASFCLALSDQASLVDVRSEGITNESNNKERTCSSDFGCDAHDLNQQQDVGSISSNSNVSSHDLHKSKKEDHYEEKRMNRNDDSNSNEIVRDCIDEHEKCYEWSRVGECGNNPSYMLHFCRKSCLVCGEEYGVWGIKQLAPDHKKLALDNVVPDVMKNFHHRMLETDAYMLRKVFADSLYEEVREDCQNRDERCTAWAAMGECTANTAYMRIHCAPACFTCEMLDMKHRCPLNMPDKWAWNNPGDLNHMFERLLIEPQYKQFEPKIHSMPNITKYRHKILHKQQQNHHQHLHYQRSLVEIINEQEISKFIEQQNQPNFHEVKEGPWVLTLENFLTNEECDTLIQLGSGRGYETSYNVGEKKFDGTHEKSEDSGRTSTNSWCQDDCFDHPITQQVIRKMEQVTGMSQRNSEYLQLLRYEKTQKYVEHHDYIPHHKRLPMGPRILTLYVYLSDVEAGGGTDFPLLGITSMPKRGKALIWPSVHDESPLEKDGRTNHQALPVEAGIKYGANAWFHAGDFKYSLEHGCVG